MKTTVSLVLLLSCSVLFGRQTMKNDPNGIWESVTGTRYNFRLSGSSLKVTLVEGSNPTYVKYEVDLQPDPNGEVNTYKGAGYFVAKLDSGKECRFDTEWLVIVIGEKFLTGGATRIVDLDPETCAVKEKEQVRLDLTKL